MVSSQVANLFASCQAENLPMQARHYPATSYDFTSTLETFISARECF